MGGKCNSPSSTLFLVIGLIKDPTDGPLRREAVTRQLNTCHANSQGVVGRDETIQGAKIEPLEGRRGEATSKQSGFDDEQVDASRINPMGVVREGMA